MDHLISNKIEKTRILKSQKLKAGRISLSNQNIIRFLRKDRPSAGRNGEDPKAHMTKNSSRRMILSTQSTDRRRRRAAATTIQRTTIMAACILLLSSSSWTTTTSLSVIKSVSAFVTRNGGTTIARRPSLFWQQHGSRRQCRSSVSAIRMATDSRELRFFAAAASTPSSRYTTFASSASGRSISSAAGVNLNGNGAKAAEEEENAYGTAAASSPFSTAPSAMSFESVGMASSFYSPSYYASSSISSPTSYGDGSTEASVRHQTAVFFSKPLKATAEATAAESSTQETAAAVTTTTQKPFMQLRYHATESSSPPKSPAPSLPSDEGPTIKLTPEEQKLFKLLVQVIQESPDITSTLRVAGGWVRDKLLATDEFRRNRDMCASKDSSEDEECEVTRLTSKYKTSSHAPSDGVTATGPSAGRHGTKVIGGGGSSSPRMDENGFSTSTLMKQSNPVDIDIALDDMLGKDFAELLNHWLSDHGRQTHSVGVVLKNPEKSKHLETATMKVGQFWIDFVNLRAEEYTEDSRIPDLMRIGTPTEDAYRRDLTINALFYNINTGRVEDMTGRGFDDLRKGVVATPLPPLTTLLDDPLRVLRAIRFAARLRFGMDEPLRMAAADSRVREALAQKVSRERVGSEVDLMLRSPDPVGAMRLLTTLKLASTVFPLGSVVDKKIDEECPIFDAGLRLLSTTHDHLCYCKANPPVWCSAKVKNEDGNKDDFDQISSSYFCNGYSEIMLMDDEESRRLLWYAAFLKPLRDYATKVGKDRGDNSPRRQGKKSSRSVITHMMVDQLKRPSRDAEAAEKVMKAADDFTRLITSGFDAMSMKILLSDIRVAHHYGDMDDLEVEEECPLNKAVNGYSGTSTHEKKEEEEPKQKPQIQSKPPRGFITCSMDSAESGSKMVDPVTEDDPLWLEAMEYRLMCSKILHRAGHLWRAALILSLSEQLEAVNSMDMIEFAIEGDVIEESKEEVRQGIIAKYDAFAASLLELGLVGIWSEQPLLDGREMKQDGVLPNIPKGPVFREIMDEQANWMITHPGGDRDALVRHLHEVFPEYV